jgi:ATP-binding cassette subfamily F protein 3
LQQAIAFPRDAPCHPDARMPVLTLNSVSRRFGDVLILDNVSFVINRGDRAGLIGPNGAGKSTLLRIMAAEDAPDAGTVSLAPAARVGHLRQGFADFPEGTLADLLDGLTGGLASSHEDVSAALSAYDDPEADPDQVTQAYDQALERFDAAGGYAVLDELAVLLARFGLEHVPFSTPLAELSGGQKTRAGLAALLASRPDLLVLDEPTNHLDVDALSWLANFLRDYPGAVVMVSHDRGFLDDIVTRILELDPDSHTLTSWSGNYSAYVAARQHHEEEQAAAYARQQRDIARITEDIRGAEHHARTIEANTIDFAVRAKAAKIARPAVVRKRKLERLLESTEYVEKPRQKWGLHVELPVIGEGARDILIIEDATLGYGDMVVLHGVSLHVRSGARVAIVGPNGGGKSTLIRSVAGELAPLAGSVRLGPGVRPGYFSQEQDTLDLSLTVLEQARAASPGSDTDLRSYLHKYLFGGDMVYRQVGSLSYGERARLMLAVLALGGTSLLLLDEPLNHLDIDAREAFEQALLQFEGTMLLVLHDRYAIQRLSTRVIEVRGGRVHDVVGLERDTA